MEKQGDRKGDEKEKERGKVVVDTVQTVEKGTKSLITQVSMNKQVYPIDWQARRMLLKQQTAEIKRRSNQK